MPPAVGRSAADVVALGYRYPDPGAAARIRDALGGLRGPARSHLTAFVNAVADLDLGQWEELHTRTLDLDPLAVPYIGHLIWGDSYRRGAFMAELARAMSDAGVETGGELPDHIEPVLRYLATAAEPLPELIDVLPAAVRSMAQALGKAAPDNAYRHLVAATIAVTDDLHPVAIGGNRTTIGGARPAPSEVDL